MRKRGLSPFFPHEPSLQQSFFLHGPPLRKSCLSAALSTLPYGSTAVTFRFGTCPTGIFITSRIAFKSTTDTEFEAALAT